MGDVEPGDLIHEVGFKSDVCLYGLLASASLNGLHLVQMQL